MSFPKLRSSVKPVVPAEIVPPKKGQHPIPLVRGMRDLLPVDALYWRKMYAKAEELAQQYGYDRIDTPIIEDTALFVRGVGRSTDVVEKELYSFETAGGEQVSLRPENTASIARAYVQHGMLNQPQPVKVWYAGPMFRHDRPQAGRFRQFYQWGFECLGEQDAIVDAQMMLVGWNFLKELGIDDAIVRVNSLGTPESRVNYRNALVTYFRSKRSKLSEDDKKRLLKNPLRLLDSKEAYMQELKQEAPQIVDWLDEESKAHFMRVLEYLDEAGVPYQLDPYLVRGLDYYTKTVFEYYASNDDQELAQSALGAGSRYDGLVEMLGGRPTPAVGFAMGLDRVASRLKDRQPVVAQDTSIDVFLAQLGEMGRKKALGYFEEFRRAGIPVCECFAKSALKAQMEAAHKRAAKWVIIVGQKEVLDGTAIVRDMDSGTQEIVDAKKLVQEIRKKIATRTRAEV